MPKTYTVGQIASQGLLKNHQGEPYRHAQTVLKIVQGWGLDKVPGPFGPEYRVPQRLIDNHNKTRVFNDR